MMLGHQYFIVDRTTLEKKQGQSWVLVDIKALIR